MQISKQYAQQFHISQKQKQNKRSMLWPLTYTDPIISMAIR